MNLKLKFAKRIDSDSGYDNLKLAEDLVNIAKKHFSKKCNLTDVGSNEVELNCICKQPTFTRVVDENYNPTCGKCGKTI